MEFLVKFLYSNSQGKFVIPKPFAKTLIRIGYDIKKERDVHIKGFDAFWRKIEWTLN